MASTRPNSETPRSTSASTSTSSRRCIAVRPRAHRHRGYLRDLLRHRFVDVAQYDRHRPGDEPGRGLADATGAAREHRNLSVMSSRRTDRSECPLEDVRSFCHQRIHAPICVLIAPGTVAGCRRLASLLVCAGRRLCDLSLFVRTPDRHPTSSPHDDPQSSRLGARSAGHHAWRIAVTAPIPTFAGASTTTAPPAGAPLAADAQGNQRPQVVALTFDAGSDVGSTAQILDTSAEQIRASFDDRRWRRTRMPSAASLPGHHLVNHTVRPQVWTGLSSSYSPLTAKPVLPNSTSRAGLQDLAGHLQAVFPPALRRRRQRNRQAARQMGYNTTRCGRRLSRWMARPLRRSSRSAEGFVLAGSLFPRREQSARRKCARADHQRYPCSRLQPGSCSSSVKASGHVIVGL